MNESSLLLGEVVATLISAAARAAGYLCNGVRVCLSVVVVGTLYNALPDLI